MVGLDPSGQQLVAARRYLEGSVPLVRGTVLSLPFRPGTFDFAYIINVLHHMPTPAHQEAAMGEIAGVVRPGGLVFVHEMSVVNPLFRLYLSYVFPILKGIEEGTEYYLDPRRLPPVPGLRLVDVRCFTFVPDFVPPTLLPALAAVERRLERSALARYAAHFVAVYERTGEGPGAVGPASVR
jgi:SAM-dependent methyltransferase